MLGTEEVKNIVLSQVMFNSFKRLKKSEGFSVSRYWQHCFVCRLGTKMLASKTGKTSSDYFVAGLIHDIGKLVEYLAVPEMFRKINEKKDMPPFMFVEEEQRIIGTTHCYLGQCLLKRWMFPDTIVAASGFHHSPEKAGDHQFLSEVVCAADLMTWFVEAEAEPVREAAAQQFRERSFPVCTGQHGLDLSENSIDAITAELAVVKEQEQELFKLLL